jgi:hypothetical protein
MDKKRSFPQKNKNFSKVQDDSFIGCSIKNQGLEVMARCAITSKP